MGNLRTKQLETHQNAAVDLRGRSNIVIETPLFDEMSQEERINRINGSLTDSEQESTEYEFMYAKMCKKHLKKAFILFIDYFAGKRVS